MLRRLSQSARESLAGRHYLERVIGNAGWVLAERAVRHLLGFLVGIWIARHLGTAEYGLLNYAAAVVAMLAFLSILGVDGIAVRDMVSEPAAREETLGSLLLLRIAGGVLLVALLAIALLAFRTDDSIVGQLILLISLAQLLLAVDSIDCWFQASSSIRTAAIAKTAAVLASAALRVVLIAVDAPLLAFAGAIVAESVFIGVGLTYAYTRSGWRLARLRASLPRMRRLVADGWPLIVSTVVAMLYLRLDQVMLGYLTSFEQVGTYAVAVRIVEATYIVPTAIAVAVFPAIVKSRDLDAAIYSARMQALYDATLWAAILIAVPVSLLAPFIVRLLVGAQYEAAGPVLAVLAWMPIWTFLAFVRQRWFFAENALWTGAAMEMAGCMVNIAANLLLIPRYGAAGAAFASLISAAAAAACMAPFSAYARKSLAMHAMAFTAPLRVLRIVQSRL
jgi:O-antigen/teichoic acid export membrane protein